MGLVSRRARRGRPCPLDDGRDAHLLRDGARILVGHSGSMPGFIAAAYVAPADRVAAAMGGGRIEVCWRSGTLEAAPVDKPDWKPPAVLQRDGTDRWRVISGWEQGELLRVERDEAGEIVRLVLAGYPVTREPTRWV
jgi:hypothetical protein